MPRALVTGAGQRLGRSIALALADAGHDVAVHYATSRSAASEVAGLIRAKGRRAEAIACDLTVEGETATLVERAAAALGGPLTCLVNNASIFEPDSLTDASRAGWDRHMECNLRAPFVLIQHFAAQAPAPDRDAAGEPLARALAVNMIDQRVRKLTPQFATYTLSKAALWTLTQTAAQALAPSVRVNAIGPGPTLQGARQNAEDFASQRAATILSRGANTGDITAALTYFLSAPAVTGQMLCIDGGQHLGWATPDATVNE